MHSPRKKEAIENKWCTRMFNKFYVLKLISEHKHEITIHELDDRPMEIRHINNQTFLSHWLQALNAEYDFLNDITLYGVCGVYSAHRYGDIKKRLFVEIIFADEDQADKGKELNYLELFAEFLDKKGFPLKFKDFKYDYWD